MKASLSLLPPQEAPGLENHGLAMLPCGGTTAADLIIMETLADSSSENHEDADGWLVFKKGEVLVVEEQHNLTKWRGMVLQTEESGFFNPKTCKSLAPSALKLTDHQVRSLMQHSYRRSQSPPPVLASSPCEPESLSLLTSSTASSKLFPYPTPTTSPPPPLLSTSPSPVPSSPRHQRSSMKGSLLTSQSSTTTGATSPPLFASFPPPTKPQHIPRLEVWNPRPMSPGSLRAAMSEVSISTLSLGSSISSLSGSCPSLTSVMADDHHEGSSGGGGGRIAYRTNSLTFYEEEEEEPATDNGESNFTQRRASADLIDELVAARRRKESFPGEPRSSSLPNFKRVPPLGTAATAPTSPTPVTLSLNASNALAVSAKLRLQSTEGVSQDVLDRKAKALERVEFAKNKKQQMLVRRHSSPNFGVVTSDKTLFAITEVSEPELVSSRTVPSLLSSPLATSTPVTASSPTSEGAASPEADSPKLGKRFQRRANSMGLTSTLDGIDEMDEESKEALRRRSISEGTYRGKPRPVSTQSKEDDPEKTKKRRLTHLLKGLRRLGSKSKLLPAPSDK